MADSIVTLRLTADGSGMVRVVSQTRRQVSGELKGVQNEATATGRALGSVGASLKQFGAGILAGAGIGSIVAVLSSATTRAREFETSMAEVATLLDDTSGLDATAEAVKRVAAEYGGSAPAQAKALYQIISAGADSTAQALETLDAANRLAIGGLTDVTTAADGLTSLLNAYGDSAGSATNVSDSLFVAMRAGKTTIGELSSNLGKVAPIANSAGVGLDELAASVAAITLGGTQTAEAVTQVRQVIAGVIKPTSEAQKTAEALGLQFDVQAIKAKGLSGFLADVAAKTGGNQATMAKLFGSVEALNAVLALTGPQAEAFADILDDMGSKAGATDEAFGKIAETAEVQFGRLSAAVGNKLIELGGTINSVLAPAAGFLADNIDAVVDGFILAAQVTGAYIAVFVALPALITATTAAWTAYTQARLSAALADELGLATATTGVSALRSAALVLFAAFAGWQIGTYLREQFVEVRVAGLAFVGALLKGWEAVRYGAQVAFAGVKAAVFAVINEVRTRFAALLSSLSSGLARVPGFGEIAQEIALVGESMVAAAEESETFAEALARLGAEYSTAKNAVDETIEDLISYELSADAAKAGTEGLGSAATAAVPPMVDLGTVSAGLDGSLQGAKKATDDEREALLRMADQARETSQATSDFHRLSNQLAVELGGPGVQAAQQYAAQIAVIDAYERALLALGPPTLANIREIRDARLDAAQVYRNDLDDIASAAEDSAERVEVAFEGAFDGLDSAFSSFVTGARGKFDEFVDGMVSEFQRGLQMLLQQLQQSGLSQGLASIGQGLAGMFAGPGGQVAAGAGIGSVLFGGSRQNQIGGAVGGLAGGVFAGTTFGASLIGSGLSAIGIGASLGSIVPVVGTIVGAILGAALGQLFEKTPRIAVGAQYNDARATSELGTIGTARFGTMERGDAGRFAQAIAEFDNAIAGMLARLPEGAQHIEEVRATLSTWTVSLRGDSATIEEVLNQRFAAIVGTFSADIQAFVNSAGDLQSRVEALGEILTLESVIAAGDALLPTLSELLPVLTALQDPGETLIDTYVRAAAATSFLEQALSLSGVALDLTRVEFISFASEVVDAAGGLERAAALWAAYYDEFYTDTELATIQLTQAIAARNEALAGLNLDPNITNEAFRAAFEAALPTLSAAEIAQWLEAGYAIAQANAAQTAYNATLGETTPAVEEATDSTGNLRDSVRQLSADMQTAADEYDAFAASIAEEAATIGLSDLTVALRSIRQEEAERIATLNALAIAAGRAGAAEEDLANVRAVAAAQIEATLADYWDTYYGAFYTETERAQMQLNQAIAARNTALAGLNLDPNITDADFRSAFEAALPTLSPEQTAQWLEAGYAIAQANAAQAAYNETLGQGTDQLRTAARQLAADMQRAADDYSAFAASIAEEAARLGLSAVAIQLRDIRQTEAERIATLNALAIAAGRAGAAESDLANVHAIAAAQIEAIRQQLIGDGRGIVEQLFGGSGQTLVTATNDYVQGALTGIGQVAQASNDLYSAQLAAQRSLLEYLNSQALGNLSTLTPEERLAEAQRQFDETAALAATGDVGALQAITRIADALLREQRDFDPDDLPAVEAAIRATIAALAARQFPGSVDPGAGSGIPAVFGDVGGQVGQVATAVDGAAQQAAIDRAALTDTLVGIVRDLLAVTGQSLSAVAESLGFSLSDLAGELGINLDALTATSVQSLAVLAGRLDVELSELARNLGAELGALADRQSLLNDAVEQTILGLPEADRAVLEPLFRAVEDATTDADANAAIADLEQAVNTIGGSTASALAPFLAGVSVRTEVEISNGHLSIIEQASLGALQWLEEIAGNTGPGGTGGSGVPPTGGGLPIGSPGGLPGTTTGSFTAGTLTTTAEDREVIAAMLSLPTLLTDLRRSVERSGDQQGDKVATATASAIVSALQRAGASRSIS